MDIKKADNKGRISGFTAGDHYFITGPLDGTWRVKEVPKVETVPEGYELAEVSDAKNLVLDLLHGNQNIDPEEVDLIGLSDEIVEQLIASGVGAKALKAVK